MTRLLAFALMIVGIAAYSLVAAQSRGQPISSILGAALPDAVPSGLFPA